MNQSKLDEISEISEIRDDIHRADTKPLVRTLGDQFPFLRIQNGEISERSGLTRRTLICLSIADLLSYKKLSTKSESDLLKLKLFGMRSLRDLREHFWKIKNELHPDQKSRENTLANTTGSEIE